jgi:hypothetical protein
MARARPEAEQYIAKKKAIRVRRGRWTFTSYAQAALLVKSGAGYVEAADRPQEAFLDEVVCECAISGKAAGETAQSWNLIFDLARHSALICDAPCVWRSDSGLKSASPTLLWHMAFD